MNKYFVLFFAVLMILPSACSQRRTRQFIVPEEKFEGVTIENWLIETPRVVAFKDVIDLSGIADTTMFWVSVRTRYMRHQRETDLMIDSALISFVPGEQRFWRYPTRVAPYSDVDGKSHYKVFDFFGDQGIVIPPIVDTILLEFNASLTNAHDSLVASYPISFRMVREEKSLSVPLLEK